MTCLKTSSIIIELLQVFKSVWFKNTEFKTKQFEKEKLKVKISYNEKQLHIQRILFIYRNSSQNFSIAFELKNYDLL